MTTLLTNIGSPSRPSSYPFMTPSAGLVEGMGSLSLIEYDQPGLLPPYQLPSPSLHLALDKGWPLPVLHPSLPLPIMTPPSSPTPLPTPPPTHSVSKREHSKRHKDWMDLYGPKKRGQCCRPSSPIYMNKEGVNVTILEAGEGDRSPGGSQMLSEGGGFGEGGVGA